MPPARRLAGRGGHSHPLGQGGVGCVEGVCRRRRGGSGCGCGVGCPVTRAWGPGPDAGRWAALLRARMVERGCGLQAVYARLPPPPYLHKYRATLRRPAERYGKTAVPSWNSRAGRSETRNAARAPTGRTRRLGRQWRARAAAGAAVAGVVCSVTRAWEPGPDAGLWAALLRARVVEQGCGLQAVYARLLPPPYLHKYRATLRWSAERYRKTVVPSWNSRAGGPRWKSGPALRSILEL